MKRIYLFITLLSFTSLSAQITCHVKLIDKPVKNTDSLEMLANKYKHAGFDYLHILLNLEYNLERNSSEKFGKYLNTIKKLSIQQKNNDGLAIYWYLLGKKAFMDNNRIASFEYYNKALQFFKTNRDTVGMTLIHVSLAQLNTTGFGKTIGNPKAVLSHCNEAMLLAKSSKNIELEIIALGVLSGYYYLPSVKNFKKMEEIELRKLSLIKNNPPLKQLSIDAHINLSTVYFYQDKFEKAYILLDSTYQVAKSISNPKSFRIFLNNFAIACMYTNRFDESYKYLRKGLSISNKKDFVYQQSIYKNLQELYTLKSDYENALAYADSSSSLKDSIFQTQTILRLNEVQTKYETHQKEVENSALKKQNQLAEEKNTQFKCFLAVLSLVSLLILYLMFRLRESNSRLNQTLANELVLNQTKNKIFSLLSHDLRKPLNELSDLIVIWPKVDTNQRENILKTIGLELINVQFVLNNLLQWAVAQLKHLPSPPRPTDIGLLLQDSMGQVNKYAQQKNIIISEKIDSYQLIVDENQLLIVFRNLLHNAIKFTEIGGRIHISTEIKSDTFKIKIRDTGIGIPQEHLEKLFAYPSPRTGTSGEVGTGVGLTLCKELVEANKGSIQVKSKCNVGTEIVLSFNIAS
jgi:signal transduction histidine kinase